MMRKGFVGVLCLMLSLTIVGCGTDEATQQVIDNIDTIGEIDTSDIELIEETVGLYADLSDEQKERVDNYALLAEAESKLDDLKRQYAVENDKTPPTIGGMEDGEVIEVRGGTTFNLNDYLDERLSITDDVTEGPLEYRTDCSNGAYDSITGSFDTQRTVEADVTLVAVDEAGNEGRLSLTVRVIPVRVSKDDPTPVIYEGEYGTVTVKSFTHEDNYGLPMYLLTLEVTNDSDENLIVSLRSPMTTVNGVQAAAHHYENYIPPGIRGNMEIFVYDEDIPEDVGEFSTIDSYVGFYRNVGEDPFFYFPITLDVNVSG